MSDHLRILLSQAASEALLAAGECFVIAGKSSHPEIAGRIVLHLVSIPKAQADAACEVALGLRRPGSRIATASANERDIHEPSPKTKST